MKQSIAVLKKRLKFVGLGGVAIVAMVCCAIAPSLQSGPNSTLVQAATGSSAIVQASPQTAPHQTAPQLMQMGLERYQAGQFAAAIALLQQALAQYTQQGDRLNQAVVQSNLALAYQQLGQFAEANQAIATSLALVQASQIPEARQLKAQALNIQGSVQLSQGKAEQALETWQTTTHLYQQLGDQAGVYRSLVNQSQALRALGLYVRAKSLLEQASTTLQQQADPMLQVAGLLNLGDVLRRLGDFQQSQAVLQHSLAIAQQNPAIDQSVILLSLGNTQWALQQPQAALATYQKAAATAPTVLGKIQAHLNQFSLLLETQQRPAAQALTTQIQPLFADLPPSRAAILARINYAKNLSRLEQTTATVTQSAQLLAKAAQQAKQLADPRAESYALGYLAELYEQTQQWDDAKRLTARSLALAQMSNASDIAYRWQWQLGRLLATQGDRTEAIAAYTQAVNTLRSIRNDLVSSALDVQFSFRESVEPVYRQLVGLLLQPENGQETSQANLRKAREVVESLQLAELDNFFQEACLQGREVQIDQIDPQAAVIYPIILSDRLEVVLSIPNQPLRHAATPLPQPELERSIRLMRQSLARSASRQERLAIAQKMYDLLIRPFESDLQTHDIKTLAFVLDGALKSLPMAALHDGNQYLLEKYNLALTPGLQLLSPKALQPQQLKVLIGGLSEQRGGFTPLPGVEVEVKQIASEIPSQLLFNQTFTAESLQQRIQSTPYPVVHLATHGQFSSNVDDTFILTWNRQLNVKELGSLLQTRDEITREPIELLVLSACQTAAGDQRAALGLAGVAVRSGARSTLATLWSVDDESTSLFMRLFYQQLAKPGIRKSEALRLAQLELLKRPEMSHPYFWAPFVMVGNWL